MASGLTWDWRPFRRELAAQRRAVAVVPFGMSKASYRMRCVWASRRQRYGPSGYRPEALVKMREIHRAVGRRNQHVGQRCCVRGHRFTMANTYVTTAGSRQCRACMQIARGLARWQKQVIVRGLRRLRDAMIAAHPDKGGTARKFLKARQAYLAARKAA